MSNLVPLGKKAAGLAVRHGPKAKMVWDVAGKKAAEQVQIQRARAKHKKSAFDKARTVTAGSVLRQLHGDQVVWIVYSGDEPVAAYPEVTADLAALVGHADLTQRRTPADYDRTRATARAKRAAQAAARRVRRSG